MKILIQDYQFSDIWKMKKSLFKTITSPHKIGNFLAVKFSKLLKLEKTYGYPINILIEPTRHCNYACLMCPRQINKLADKKLDNPVMSLEQFKKIIDEIGKFLITIRFWHYGEPLLNPAFCQMVRYAKKKNVFTVTSSNLEKLTPELTDELIDSGLDYLIVSFNGANPETYNKYTGNRGDFKNVVKNIAYLAQRKRERNSRHPFINLQFIIMKDNDREIEEMKRLAEEMGIDKLSFKYVIGLNKEIQEKLESENPNFQFKIEERNKKCDFCSLPWEECVISANGEVSVCAIDIFNEELMGNIFHESFSQIWNNQKYQAFRKRIKENIESIRICNYCSKRNNPDFFIDA